MQTDTKAAFARRPTLTTPANADSKSPTGKPAATKPVADATLVRATASPVTGAGAPSDGKPKPVAPTEPGSQEDTAALPNTTLPCTDPDAEAAIAQVAELHVPSSNTAPPELRTTSEGVAQPTLGTLPAAAPAWSSEDEASLQAMLARRKAAGYQRRGKDVAGQVLCAGEIAHNAGTVVATIVGLVAEQGTVSRGKLLDAMATTVFPHAKARPADRGWCQGYVAGALRDGFLTIVGEAPR